MDLLSLSLVQHRVFHSQHSGQFMILGKSLLYAFETKPIGSAGPKFTTDDKSATFERLSGLALSLTCPAQGFPLPAFRSGFKD